MYQKYSHQQMKQRFKDLIKEIALGKSNVQIANALGWTKNEVTNTRSKLYYHISLQDSREITIYALKTKIVTEAELVATILIIPL